MPQLDGMSFFSQFIWFSMVFTTIYAFILKRVMRSIATNLKFRMKKLDTVSTILTDSTDDAPYFFGLRYFEEGIIPLLHEIILDYCLCIKEYQKKIIIGQCYFLRFTFLLWWHNLKFLPLHILLVSKILAYKTKPSYKH
jgi:hypothetical protein